MQTFLVVATHNPQRNEVSWPAHQIGQAQACIPGGDCSMPSHFGQMSTACDECMYLQREANAGLNRVVYLGLQDMKEAAGPIWSIWKCPLAMLRAHS